MPRLLEIENLRTQFFTSDGTVRAVDGISYNVEEGETVGIVGESGCGKSVSALSILRLIPNPPGRIVGGSIRFMGTDLLRLSDAEIRGVRGRQIAMVFQEPMTSLNPVLTIGLQLTETLTHHLGMDEDAARARAVELLGPKVLDFEHLGSPNDRDETNGRHQPTFPGEYLKLRPIARARQAGRASALLSITLSVSWARCWPLTLRPGISTVLSTKNGP